MSDQGIRVAVTGGAGQLGTLVMRGLCRDPDVGLVRCLDLRKPTVASPKVEAVVADVRDPSFARHLEGIDAVAHLAFVVTKHLPRERYEAINVGGSRNVFNAAAQCGVQTIVYASSVAAYGVVPGHPEPLVEASERQFQPNFAYSACKWLVEDLLDAFEEDHPDIAVSRMRPTILLGRTMDHPLGSLLRARRMVSLGGDRPLPIVWDEDVADAFVLALKHRARGAYNLCTQDGLTAEDLARAGGLHLVRLPERVLRGGVRLSGMLANLGVGEAHDPAWTEVTSRARLCPAPDKAREDLGWSPRCATASEVIRRYVRVAPRGGDPRLYAALTAAVSVAGDRARELLPAGASVHLEVEGPRGGDFGLTFDGPRLSLSRSAPRPPSVRLALRDEDMFSLLSGKTSFEAARRDGRVEIEGDEAEANAAGHLLGSLRNGEGLRGAVLGGVGRLLAR